MNTSSGPDMQLVHAVQGPLCGLGAVSKSLVCGICALRTVCASLSYHCFRTIWAAHKLTGG